jgi:hypothetical protein
MRRSSRTHGGLLLPQAGDRGRDGPRLVAIGPVALKGLREEITLYTAGGERRGRQLTM